MAVFIFIGWLVGLLIGAVGAIATLIAFGVTVPPLFVTLTALITPVIAPLSANLAVLFALIFLIAAYIVGYAIGTAAIATQLPPLLPPGTTLPPQSPVGATAPVTVPATRGEYFARGMMIGLTAMLNFIVLSLIPVAGTWLGGWAFALISLGAIIVIARSRLYQGFLGWSAWLFPLSLLATAIGLIIFLINVAFSFTSYGLGAFRIDWTTGVITSAGGLAALVPNTVGFSIGNFVFFEDPPATDDFTVPSTASHETGHTLNTAIGGAIVLAINWIDENFWPARLNLAYGELAAEGHAQKMPGTPQDDYAIRLWF